MTLAMVGGMPTMVRSRFSTPTIGRDWMIGELGAARTDIDPDGVVTVRDAPWRARTNRATPIRKDEPARVVAIEGMVLEVEPEEGGARDYREPTPSGE
jgi:membrane-bound serine protease (ClpP class)